MSNLARFLPRQVSNYPVSCRPCMKMHQPGFTLIELMITVAIIGILSALAIPIYQGNVMKAQVNRVVSELSSYKTAFETQVSSSGAVTNSELGYSASNLTAVNSVTSISKVNADGSGHLQVTMGGNAHPILVGVIVRFERSSSGTWQCVIDPTAATRWKDEFSPGSCTVI